MTHQMSLEHQMSLAAGSLAPSPSQKAVSPSKRLPEPDFKDLGKWDTAPPKQVRDPILRSTLRLQVGVRVQLVRVQPTIR